MFSTSPYERCPIFESESFILRLVNESDAENLLKCYSDLSAVKLMNSDNCINNFHYKTIDEMKDCILFWLKEYESKAYIRFSIIDKQIQKAVGTIEIFGRKETDEKDIKFGVLRIDLCSGYEKRSYITELLQISNEHFYNMFGVRHIITKAIPAAAERISALTGSGFSKLGDNTIMPYSHYYIR